MRWVTRLAVLTAVLAVPFGVGATSCTLADREPITPVVVQLDPATDIAPGATAPSPTAAPSGEANAQVPAGPRDVPPVRVLPPAPFVAPAAPARDDDTAGPPRDRSDGSGAGSGADGSSAGSGADGSSAGSGDDGRSAGSGDDGSSAGSGDDGGGDDGADDDSD